ncbi:unnamed protein product [Paramecium pentaurelia]|uniref:TmcB/TmcC TPR repeats domain-containing protein n=1 Tax=Paramecium pentaurelia TaxID=43138 RepID=A0A8S1SBV7_9CILI|nr:unnamed protein product [Paramecium pentaurelia]
MFTIYSIRIYNLLMVMLVTVFVIPFLSIFLATFKCEGQMECDSILYYIMVILSSLGIVMLSICLVFFEIFLVDYNPFTPIPYASKYTKLNWIELIFKIYLPFFAVMDPQQDAEKPFITILCIMYAMMITMRLKTRQFIENSVNISKLSQTSLLFWTSFVSVCHAYLDQGEIDDMGFFYEVVCSPLVVYCCFKLNKSPELITHMKKDIQLEETVQEMIFLIENREKPINRMKLEGFVKLHQKDCLKSVEQCPCSLIHQDTLRNQDNEKTNDKQSLDKTIRWYAFVQALIQNSSDRLQTTRIQIIRSYVLQKKLKNKFKSFYELAIAQKQRLQFQDEFCIYRVMNQIELEMIEQDKNQEIDVQQIVNFQNYYIQFETAIEKSVNLHLEYWRELQEESPDIGKLQQLGASITSSIDETEQLYDKLIKINSIHLKTLEIYGNFLTHVVNNDIEGTRIIDKSDQISKNLEINRIIDSEKFKYDQNSDTCIITCSVNIENLGAITNCNNEIQKLLGYKKADLLRSNVSRIMPRILASVHDDFIRNFIQTSQSKVLGIERQVFALNKNGFLVPCSLMIRVLPNLKNGLQIVGFLKKSDNTDKFFYLMFDELSHSILGFNESVYDKFGVPAGVANGQLDLPIIDIAPELIELCKKQGAFNFTIDTTGLSNNYQIVQDESLEDIQQQEDQSAFYGISRDPYEQNILLERKEYSQINEKTANNDKSMINDKTIIHETKQITHKSQKYKSALVKGLLVEDSEYANAKIKIIQFIEESQEELLNKVIEDKKLEEEQPDIVENVIQSEVSGGSGLSVNEEIRQIKEFKIQMGEKSEASKIIVLNRIVIILSTILIVLSSIQLGYRLQQNDELLNGHSAITMAYYRTGVMADVVFYTRYLQLMAYGNVTYDQSFRDKLSLQVNQLKSIQYSLIKSRIDMEAKKNVFTDTTINVTYLYDNVEQNYSSSLSDAIFQLVTSASIIRNASLLSFIDPNSTENTVKNVFFIIRNGYQLLRQGSQDVSEIYYDFFVFIIGDYDSIFYAVLSLAIASLVIAQFFLVPIVLKVHNINNKVMSLFGLLTQKDIKELAQRSEQFKNTYLSNMQNTIKEQAQAKAEMEKLQEKHKKNKNQEQIDQSNLIVEINNEQPQPSIDVPLSLNQQPLPSSLPTHKNIDKLQLQQQQEHDEQQILDSEAMRQQKLLNSKASNTFSVSIKFILMMMIFMAYFIINITLEQQLTDQSVIIYNHLKYSSIRAYNLKYSIYFTLEQILQSTNYKEEYIEALYENERLCLESLQQSFSSKFDPYISLYNQFNLQSLCLQSFSTEQFVLDVNQCSILSGGILDRGLRNSITSLALWASNTISTDIKILDSQQVKNYIEQVYYIDQAIVYLNTQYSLGMADFVESEQQIEKIKFSVFIIGLVFIFLFIWTPYNKEMSRQIWRTKGMLNMIPFEMIKAQETLKNAFLKGNIIAAVK